VYSRVVGYLRPVQQWNEGKQAEYSRRRVFKVPAPQAAETGVPFPRVADRPAEPITANA
jgi:ribonucleoside-triphosphate reductase